MASQARCIVFFGTYSSGEDEGVYVYELSRETGELTKLATSGGIVNPSFVVVSPDGRFLYAVAETASTGGRPGGAVAAFAIDPETFALTKINEQSAMGRGPCHIDIDATGRMLLVANYSEGNIASYPLKENGSMDPAASTIQHEGSSVNEKRQEQAHAHSINVDPTNRFAFACDLGTDEVLAYRLNVATGAMTKHDTYATKTPPGAGPRHFAFHPGGRFAYAINELDNTMIAYAYDGERGVLKQLQVITTLPDDFTDTSHCADVHVSPNGRFVYGSNRGHDSLAIFAIDPDKGTLSTVGYESTRGRVPRGFNLDPSGAVLLAANQNSDNVVTFHVDEQTGEIHPTGHEIVLPKPVCVKVIEV